MNSSQMSISLSFQPVTSLIQVGHVGALRLTVPVAEKGTVLATGEPMMAAVGLEINCFNKKQLHVTTLVRDATYRLKGIKDVTTLRVATVFVDFCYSCGAILIQGADIRRHALIYPAESWSESRSDLACCLTFRFSDLPLLFPCLAPSVGYILTSLLSLHFLC